MKATTTTPKPVSAIFTSYTDYLSLKFVRRMFLITQPINYLFPLFQTSTIPPSRKSSPVPQQLLPRSTCRPKRTGVGKASRTTRSRWDLVSLYFARVIRARHLTNLTKFPISVVLDEDDDDDAEARKLHIHFLDRLSFRLNWHAVQITTNISSTLDEETEEGRRRRLEAAEALLRLDPQEAEEEEGQGGADILAALRDAVVQEVELLNQQEEEQAARRLQAEEEAERHRRRREEAEQRRICVRQPTVVLEELRKCIILLTYKFLSPLKCIILLTYEFLSISAPAVVALASSRSTASENEEGKAQKKKCTAHATV